MPTWNTARQAKFQTPTSRRYEVQTGRPRHFCELALALRQLSVSAHLCTGRVYFASLARYRCCYIGARKRRRWTSTTSLPQNVLTHSIFRQDKVLLPENPASSKLKQDRIRPMLQMAPANRNWHGLSVKDRSSLTYLSNVQQHWSLAVVVTAETYVVCTKYRGVITDSSQRERCSDTFRKGSPRRNVSAL